MKKYIFFALSALALSSCNDFLDRQPLDFAGEEAYYKTDADLKVAVNNFYTILPKNNTSGGNTGIYTEDFTSDDQCGNGAQNLLYPGNKRTPEQSQSEWNFSNLRGINFFIQKVYENFKIDDIDAGTMTNHYLGEAYFFRAFDHFRLLRNFGDAPIITKMVSDDHDQLVEASKRYPRNEVARFIIAQLDTAARLMNNNVTEAGRLTRDAAYALKSRVALYEGTWEKYHAGTCFVPGNEKWVGKTAWPEFRFPAGSADAEVNWFLEQAIDASEKAVANHPLYGDYMSMFNSTDCSGMSEVILARYYLPGILAHNCSYYLKGGGGNGLTRQAVNTFLMANGLPIYAPGSGYRGDNNTFVELQDRDPRLAGKRNPDGSYPQTGTRLADKKLVPVYGNYGIVRAAGLVKNGNDTVFYYAPAVANTGQDKSTTGYEINKWVTTDPDQQVLNGTYTAVPLLRSAECMLNYMEAYYERYGNLGGNCDRYWKEIRRRAGVDEDYNATIAATDLSKENDLGVYSKGKTVDVTLYNIRRERRTELITEGRRTDDLKRWRSFDSMQGWQPEGFNFWTEIYNMYTAENQKAISDKSISTYMHPLELSANAILFGVGYQFPKPHYLEPIPISELTLTVVPSTGKSIIYQNPGWPDTGDGLADYTYDCD